MLLKQIIAKKCFFLNIRPWCFSEGFCHPKEICIFGISKHSKVFFCIYHDPHVPPWVTTLTWLWSLHQWEGSAHAREFGEAATNDGGMPRHILDELLTAGSEESLLSMKSNTLKQNSFITWLIMYICLRIVFFQEINYWNILPACISPLSNLWRRPKRRPEL